MAAFSYRTTMNATTILATVFLAVCAGQACAGDASAPASVEITGIRNPVLQPYRIMAAGFTAMEDHRALAPDARELRFGLAPRASAPPGTMQGLTLRLEGDATDLALPIGADSTFTLPRSESAAADNAALVFNRKQNYIRWLPHIRSPGVPAGFVRLGDARMQCQVLVAVARKMVNIGIRMLVNGVLGLDWCASDKFHIPSFSARRVASATLIHNGERIDLRVSEDGGGFYAPVSDKRYGHDDLIELTYVTDAPPA